MNHQEIQKIRNLVSTSQLLSSTERVEWLNLMELMNDKQFLELEKILAESQILDLPAPHPVPSQPVLVPPVKSAVPQKPKTGLHLDHILNIPKPWDTKVQTAGTAQITSAPLPKIPIPPIAPSVQKISPVLPKTNTSSVVPKSNPVLASKEPLELKTSKPQYPLELEAPHPVITASSELKPTVSLPLKPQAPIAQIIPKITPTSESVIKPAPIPMAVQPVAKQVLPQTTPTVKENLKEAFPAGFIAPQKTSDIVKPLPVSPPVEEKTIPVSSVYKQTADVSKPPQAVEPAPVIKPAPIPMSVEPVVKQPVPPVSTPTPVLLKENLKQTFPAGFVAPQKISEPVTGLPKTQAPATTSSSSLSPISPAPIEQPKPEEIKQAPIAQASVAKPETDQSPDNQNISFNLGQGSNTVINVKTNGEIDMPKGSGIAASSPIVVNARPDAPSILRPVYQAPIPQVVQPQVVQPIVIAAPPITVQSPITATSVSQTVLPQIKQKVVEQSVEMKAGLSAMPTNIHFREIGQSSKLSPVLVKQLDEILIDVKTLSSITLEVFNKFGVDVLYNKVKIFRDSQGYHEVIFFLEQSQAYKTYVTTGLQLLHQQTSFEELVKKDPKAYMTRQQFEDFTDLLRKIQA